MQSIAEVITELDTIVKMCKASGSKAGYFAALYKRMTIATANGIRAGIFQNPAGVEKLDIYFAGRYLDARQAYTNKTPCTASWQYAFDGCINPALTVIQHLILGINTHINLDLAIAAAVTAPGEKIHELEADFYKINEVIAGLADDIQKCLEEVWLPMKLLRRIANGREKDVLNFSITVARKTAWANAVLLAGMNEQEQEAHIRQMDKMVWEVGRRIINPGVWPSFALKLIRWTEYGDVSRTIELIDGKS